MIVKTRKLIEQSILFAIDDLTQTIITSPDCNLENCTNAIKILAEAYDIVHRGKKGNKKC